MRLWPCQYYCMDPASTVYYIKSMKAEQIIQNDRNMHVTEHSKK